jgi:hypothetical protein
MAQLYLLPWLRMRGALPPIPLRYTHEDFYQAQKPRALQKTHLFWEVTLCRCVCRYRRFEDTIIRNVRSHLTYDTTYENNFPEAPL